MYVEFSSLLAKDKQKKGKFSFQVEVGDTLGNMTMHQVVTDSRKVSHLCMIAYSLQFCAWHIQNTLQIW